MASSNQSNKQRRTFTLSPASLAYLEQETRRRNADSLSAVLDELLQEKRLEYQQLALEAQITAYYDSLADAEVEEDRRWGEFAGRHLALSEEEFLHVQPTTRGNLVHKAANRSSGKRKAPGGHRIGQRAKQSSAS
jgi:hypothetical protein